MYMCVSVCEYYFDSPVHINKLIYGQRHSLELFRLTHQKKRLAKLIDKRQNNSHWKRYVRRGGKGARVILEFIGEIFINKTRGA